MIHTIKDIWAETSTKIGVAVLLLMWIAAIVASFIVAPERWPQVKEALELPMGLASTGALVAIFSRDRKPPSDAA